jgi:uncharacterized membrane protein YfcA
MECTLFVVDEPAVASGSTRHGVRDERGPRRLATICCGLVAGLLSGIFGVGGGFLIVPALTLVLHMDQRRAHGTSLAAVIPIAAAGVIGYAFQGDIDLSFALFLILGAALGALVGTYLLSVLGGRTLRLAFAALLLAAALRLALPTPEATGHQELTVPVAAGLIALGAGTGVLAGLFGVGGGIVIVPALILFFGVTDVVAKGTSLLVILPTALVGTASNLRRGNADIGIAALVGGSGVVAAFLGVQIAARLNHTLSTATFAVLLLVASARLATTRERPARGRARPTAE